MKKSLHNEGKCKWVNCLQYFFQYQLLQTTYGSQQFAEIGGGKVNYFDFPSEIFEILVWIRCWGGNCPQLLLFWNVFVQFRFFLLKLAYFWTKSRKKYGCFFQKICATALISIWQPWTLRWSHYYNININQSSWVSTWCHSW